MIRPGGGPSMSNQKTKKRERWRAIFEEWSSSGLSQRRFCDDREIRYSTFCYWRRRLREEIEIESASPFIPVEIKPTPRSFRSSHYEVRLEDGVRIRVPSDFESESLARLIGLLRGE